MINLFINFIKGIAMDYTYKRTDFKRPISISVPFSLLEKVNRWGMFNEIPSRTQAICKLLEIGLETVQGEGSVKNAE